MDNPTIVALTIDRLPHSPDFLPLLAAVSRGFHLSCCHSLLSIPTRAPAPYALYGQSKQRVEALKRVLDSDSPLEAWFANNTARSLHRFNSEFVAWWSAAEARGCVTAVSCPELQPDRFIRDFVEPGVPAMLRGLASDWQATHAWRPQQLFQAATEGRVGSLRCGEDLDGEDMLLDMQSYLCYTLAQHDDTPLYYFDRQFGERMPGLLAEYQVPTEYFPEDLLSPLQQRPPYRWFLLGPAGSGSDVHTDPPHTSAWNALLGGRKRWAIISPELSAAEVGFDTTPDDAPSLSWFMSTLMKLAESHPGKVQLIDQHQADVIFAPPGWWHATWNLDLTNVAVTHNFVTTSVFEQSILSAQNISNSESDSDSPCDLPSLVQRQYGLLDRAQADEWISALRASNPDLLARIENR